ncbi:MAG: ABC transporter permease [Lachnospiraceae bacterium]|jgi:tungstate transport system permease protein|nr:ABC transporter permease [Lachnospiraceae bacterium]
MGSALREALQMILSGSSLLGNIVGVTLRMSLASSLIALAAGVPLGVLYGSASFPGRKILLILNRTFMGFPPVVCGLLCYLMFSGVGPLRGLKLLYTVEGMIVAQVLLLIPIAAGMTESSVEAIAPAVKETCRGMGLNRRRTLSLIIRESRYQIVTIYILALGRALAEVGAVSIVGGAIAYKTNVMTTAIMNDTGSGDFRTALALGIILFLLYLLLTILSSALQGRMKR